MQVNYLELIEKNKEEMLKTLQELVAIKSVVEAPVTVRTDKDETMTMPFGTGVQEAFEYMMKKAKEDGFDVENVDNYGGHIEFGGYTVDDEGQIISTSPEVMGILGHLDVVPEGTGWKYGPYEGIIEDGKIYGRGTTDDKGPVLAAYYAMKAIKDAGIVPAKKVRLILGLDEETTWSGMEYYLSKVKAPDFGFTPDSGFPAVHGEMGILVFGLAKKFGKTTNKGLELRSITGGNAENMVPDGARAVVRADKTESYESIKAMAAEYRSKKGMKINTKGIGKSLEITAQGISAHGARPQLGLNGISVLMDFLGQLKFVNEDAGDFIEFYNKHIGFELHGEALGCGLSDEPSGKLILNAGVIALDGESAKLTINVRYPVTLDDNAVYNGILPVVNKYNMGIIKGKHQLPIYIPADDPMIVTLMDIYKKHTGDIESQPMVMGGGTYARAAKNIVAFGPGFPGEISVAHQQDEFMLIENLMKATAIYADVIYSLTKED